MLKEFAGNIMKHTTTEKFLLMLVIFITLSFWKAYADEHKTETCANWKQHLASDIQIRTFLAAGCEPEAFNDVEKYSYYNGWTGERSQRTVCYDWLQVARFEDELASWSQTCGMPRAGGGCSIWVNDDDQITVAGVCNP